MQLNSFPLLAGLWALTFFTLPLQAQIFSSQSPTDANVCSESNWSFTIENDQSQNFDAGTLTITLPECMSYVEGSVNGVLELDLSDPGQPIFEVSALSPTEILMVSLSQSMDCGCLDAINMGTLFTNEVNYAPGTESFTYFTDDYEVNTPLLVLTNITNSFFAGSRGTVFQRHLTLKNTRPGPLETIEFSDSHQGGISIEIDAGQPLPAGPDEVKVLLDGNDFQLIGDGDLLFEQDEELTIIETVTIEDCGVNLVSSLSTIDISWGCNDAACQNVQQSALVQILLNELAPVLDFNATATAPVCFCGPNGYPQNLTVFNEGDDAALDLQIELIESDAGVGIYPSSIQIDSMGQTINAQITPIDTLMVEGVCEVPGEIYNVLNLSFPELAPGDTLIISWDSYFCQTECNSPEHNWTYQYNYLNPCPPDPFVLASGLGVSSNGPLPQVIFDGPNELVSGELHPYVFQILYDSLSLISGDLVVDLLLPCGLSLESGIPTLGGVQPIEFLETPQGNDLLVSLIFELPLPSNTPGMTLDLFFDCDSLCLDGGDCVEELFSSCPEFGCTSEEATSLPIILTTTINSCQPFDTDCGIQECIFTAPSYLCIPDSICLDTIPGYIDFELSAQRINLGLPDIDDDRIADPGMPYNFNEMRLDRLIAGDTFQTELKGIVIGEIPDVAFSMGLLSLEFFPSGLDIGVNPELLSSEGVSPIGNTLRIVDASTGAAFQCTDLPILEADNTAGLAFDYSISVDSLLAYGCGLPSDFLFEAGDSIVLEAQFTVLHNPIKADPNQAFPPLIDITIQPLAALFSEPVQDREEYLSCGCDFLKLELSGFEYELFPGIFAVEPCDTSEYNGATFFEFNLAEGNFFPYEHRNLLILENLNIELPPVVELVETRISRLLFQAGQDLKNDTIIDGLNDANSWSYDFIDCQMGGLDEGFVLLLQYRFLPDCSFQGVYLMDVMAELDWAAGLPEEATPSSVEATSNAIRALLPTLQMETTITYQTSLDNQLSWFFSLENLVTTIATQNSGIAENVWVQPLSNSGLVDDFVLVDTVSGDSLSVINGIFQLGDLDTNAIQYFNLIGSNLSCSEEHILLRFGWNCSPFTDPDSTTCNQQEILFGGISPDGELELTVQAPDSCAFLCDTVPYHLVEITNVDLGAVCEPILSINLPPGFTLLPGSVEMAYPANTPFQPISDPVDLGNQNYYWALSALNTDLETTCLKGLGASPENQILLRFLGETDCDFILGSQVLFEASGEQNCGIPSNSITRQGGGICIQIDEPANQTFLNLNVDDSTPCLDVATLNLGILPAQTTAFGDSVNIWLPQGITYVPGSVQDVLNGVTGEPVIQLENGLQLLSWALPEALPPFAPVSFQINITGLDALECGSYFAQIQTTQLANAFCAQNADTCAVELESGSGLLEIEVQRPNLQVNNFSVTATDAGVLDQIFFELDLENTGVFVDQPTPVFIFLDLDQNGVFTPGDSIVFEEIYPPLEGSFNFSGAFSIPDGLACLLYVQFNEPDLCACNLIGAPVETEIQFQNGPVYDICSGAPFTVDFCPPGLTYQWEGGVGLSCLDCCDPVFEMLNDGDNPAISLFTLTVEDSLGCNQHYTVTFVVHPSLGIVFSDDMVCAGDEAVIFAADGQNYEWSGPGVGNQAGQALTITVNQTSTFYLELTDDMGCVHVDSVLIQVVDLPLAEAGPDTLSFCPDEIPQLSASILADEQLVWSPAILLDDPSSTSPIIVNPIEGWYILQVENSFGCSALDSVWVEFPDAPEAAITGISLLCLGDVDTLTASGGLQYFWSGDFGVNCLIPPLCDLVEIEPPASGTVILVAENESGCLDTTSVLVEVVDDQMMTSETLQTCQGEPISIFGNMLDIPGVYCDTAFTASGCLDIHCIELLVADTISEDFAITLCPGESINIAGQEISTPGVYFDFLNTASGCDSTVRYDLFVSSINEAEIGLETDSILLGESLAFDIIEAPAGSQFLWTPADLLSCADCPNPEAMPTEDTEFSVLITDPNGCEQLLEISIKVDENCNVDQVEIPSIFTPNGDGVNDTFGPLLPGGLEQIELFEVYSRWGELVFSGNSSLNKWDGKYKGSDLPTDVYAYRILIRCTTGERLLIGEVSLIR